jgi:hypothetical protein
MEGGAEAKSKGSQLDVRQCYQPSRMARDVLASVYEQLVAGGRPSGTARRRTAEADFEKGIPEPKQILCAGG